MQREALLVLALTTACRGEESGAEQGSGESAAPGSETTAPATGGDGDAGADTTGSATMGSDPTGSLATGEPASSSTGDTGDVDPPVVVGCESIGAVDTDGVFSLASFGDRLIVGQFGYGQEGVSMLFGYPPWGKVQPGLVGIGESVCAMVEFDGWLVANTEHSGDIFRSMDGSTWELVHDGPDGTIGCDLVEHEQTLYAVSYDNQDREHGLVLRSADASAWAPVYDSGDGTSRYLREIASFDGRLFAFSVDEDTAQGYVHESDDGVRWVESTTPARFFRSHVWNGALWLSSTERGGNGVSGIWRSDGTEHELVYPSDKAYVTELASWRGALFAGTSDGWKEDTGTSSILMSPDGESFQTVCDLPELAVWALAVHDDRLFAGTWEFEVGGGVYEIIAE